MLEKINPDEIYNLGGQTHVQVSFEIPEYTAEVDALGTLRVLDAVREMKMKTRFYQASTSELFGKVQAIPQNELTAFYPRSPYGVAKLYSYWLVVNYREAYSIHASNGILFNHESPRRSENFVSRKISLGVAAILLGRAKCISLGNLDAKRDWGYAPEYVEGMWRLMQLDNPGDFVLATGESHSVREFVTAAFEFVGKPIVWKGAGVDEYACFASGGEKVVEVNPSYFRPSEVDCLMGDASKAKQVLGWEAKTKFTDLVRIMVEADIKLMETSPSRHFVI
jgi:GDPmannose 4,6-dehydratase